MLKILLWVKWYQVLWLMLSSYSRFSLETLRVQILLIWFSAYQRQINWLTWVTSTASTQLVYVRVHCSNNGKRWHQLRSLHEDGSRQALLLAHAHLMRRRERHIWGNVLLYYVWSCVISVLIAFFQNLGCCFDVLYLPKRPVQFASCVLRDPENRTLLGLPISDNRYFSVFRI